MNLAILPPKFVTLGPLFVEESSFSPPSVQKRILDHWIYSHKRNGQSFHKSNISHPLRASVGV